MVDQSRQLQGVLCALALGIGVSLPCAFVTPNSGLKLNAKGECQRRMQRDECQGRMQRVLNYNIVTDYWLYY